MFASLPQFYTSNEWRTFRAALIAERLDRDGSVIDEYSGKPILQSYDIVLHHIKPLTMANVNDYSVSMNPANIMVVSQKSHNELHARFGYCTERKVYLVWGSPCSGKTTFVDNIKGNSDMIVDMDNIWMCITGGELYHKPNALKANAFMLRDALYDQVKTRAGRWERAFVIAGCAVKSERERLTASLGAEPIHIDTDKETCLQRVTARFNGDSVNAALWTGYINSWWEDYSE